MTPRERWLAVLEGEKPDRLPMDYWGTDEATARLVEPNAAELLAPAVVGLLGDADFASGLRNRKPLAQLNLSLPQLRDNLFDRVLLVLHPKNSLAWSRQRQILTHHLDLFLGARSVVVGQSDYGYVCGEWAGFRWTAEDGMVSLGAIPPATRSAAFAANADGSVIVGFSDSAEGTQAFRWTTEDGMVGIGDLGGLPYSGQAFDVSDDGSVIIGEGYDEETYLAMYWTADEGWINLGDLPGGLYRSGAVGVSGDGSVVVGLGSNPAGWTACFWTERTGVVNLKEWLLDHGVTEVADWTLHEVNDVSADGKTIVGAGQYPGSSYREAWVAYLGEAFPGPLGDLDGDGDVDLSDLSQLLSNYGTTSGAEYSDGDLDGDGDVDLSDLSGLLAHYGESC